jgi:prepilin-type N-terminal cleavage/methylation domain-containing protein
MRTAKGFTLTELLIVVAIAGIMAAVVIPLLSRAFISANESATLGDIRTVIDAQTGYRSANGGFYDAALSCLTAPAMGCIPSYPVTGPTFLDSALAALIARHGYNRAFQPGPHPGTVPPNASPTSVNVYRYDATPTVIGVTGMRGFAGDETGRICFTPDGVPVPPGPGVGTLPPGCAAVP